MKALTLLPVLIMTLFKLNIMKQFFLNSILLFVVCLFSITANAQTVKLLNSGSKASFRGLSVVNDNIVWVSGSAGTVGRSVDGGENWTWMTVKGFEKTDFRDIEAFDDKAAIIMGIASPAYILKTTDGGNIWKLMYENKDTSMFLDAMEFWDEKNGIVIGDPINNKIFIARTFDGGNSWKAVPDIQRRIFNSSSTSVTGGGTVWHTSSITVTMKNVADVDKGEACFASSGTNIRVISKNEVSFVTGGLSSYLYIQDRKINLPIIQGKESTGANSMAAKNKKTLIVVGGDFTTKDSTTKNCFITTDGGKTFSAPVVGPHGYRSCVEYLDKKNWISCGLNGVDYSIDEGQNWNWISKESFHACRKAKKGKAVYFSGGGGRIGKLIMN